MKPIDEILLALTRYHRQADDPNASALNLLEQYNAQHRAEVLAEEKSSREADATPHLTVYRAEHPDSGITLGHYGTAAAARAHCEATERRAWAASSAPTHFAWIEDEEDGVAEMTAFVGGEECTTGYIVTALEIPAEYDEEADE